MTLSDASGTTENWSKNSMLNAKQPYADRDELTVRSVTCSMVGGEMAQRWLSDLSACRLDRDLLADLGQAVQSLAED